MCSGKNWQKLGNFNLLDQLTPYACELRSFRAEDKRSIKGDNLYRIIYVLLYLYVRQEFLYYKMKYKYIKSIRSVHLTSCNRFSLNYI